MTVMRLNYRAAGDLVEVRIPGRILPPRDLTRADIVEMSGAGYGTTVASHPRFPGYGGSAEDLAAYYAGAAGWATFGNEQREFRVPATADAPVGSAGWLAKVDAFVAACVATGRYAAVETDDVADHQGGI
jgi:hypothetical protein